jgi:DNA-binding transcriptional LysR family regulator
MEIRVLRYFLTVAREEGINRAAEVLHITQPTLSRQLSQLEEEVGVKLFHRGAKKITLTNEGILLRRRAEEILSLVDRTQRELTLQDELVEGRIVIGGGELAAMQVLPEIIEKYREKYPLVTFDIFTGNADLVKEQMEKGLIDIGVLLEPIDIEKFFRLESMMG